MIFVYEYRQIRLMNKINLHLNKHIELININKMPQHVYSIILLILIKYVLSSLYMNK